MPDPGVPDRDDTSSPAADPRAELMAASGEGQGPAPSPINFLDKIGTPGLADIEFDASLPSSPPRDVDLD